MIATHLVMRAPRTAALLLVMAAAAPVAAQEQPVALVHGFRSDGGTWEQARWRIEQNFAARAINPTLGWDRPLADQAVTLSERMSAAAFPDTAISIGHSNGGLISRQTSRLRPLKGVMTVGTLHRGAPMANNIDVVPAWGSLWFLYNALPAEYYGYLNSYCYYSYYYCYYDPVADYVSGYAWAMAGLGAFTVPAAAYVGFSSTEVRRDMRPGSDFLEGPYGLNSPANLHREETSLAARVGIRSTVYDAYGLLWNGVLPEWHPVLTSIQYNTAYLSLFAFYYYLFYWDYNDPLYWDKQMGSWYWLLAAAFDFSIDPTWCALIGAWDGWGCTPNDGIVPMDRQTYPGVGATNYDAYGPAHTQETTFPQTQGLVDLALRYNFQVAPR